MTRSTRGGFGKLVRRTFSILEDQESSASAREYFLVEGGFNVLDRMHLFGTSLLRMSLASMEQNVSL